MRLAHLGLPVSDPDRSVAFYTTYLGFQAAKTHPDGTVLLRNAESFDLALHPVAAAIALPEFLHFGFHCPQVETVDELFERLRAAGVTILERDDEPGYVSFKCADPDGHRIEIYWEP